MVQQRNLKSGQSKARMPKSTARVKAGKKKVAHLKVWQDCVKEVGIRMGIAGLPKKGTSFYEECKRLQNEKMIQ